MFTRFFSSHSAVLVLASLAAALLPLPLFAQAKPAASVTAAAGEDLKAGIAAFEKGEFQQAAEIFGALAKDGNAEGMFYLGRMLEVGAGLPRPNTAAALAQYQAAADAGSLKARNRMGLLYISGSGVLQDFDLAQKSLKAGAEGGLADAQYNYGAMFQNGLGVPKDEAKAIAWYEKAAAQGHLAANATLGEAYFNGTGVQADAKKAYAYHKVPAERGAPFSQYRLGTFLSEGTAAPKDVLQAHVYLNLAAAAGVPDAGAERDALGKAMTAADVLKAQQMARDWKPKAAQ